MVNVHMTYMEGPYKVYNNSTDVLEWCLKLNLYWSTGTCLWQSTRLKAMCPRWTLLAAAFHLECKYLQCVCVCVCLRLLIQWFVMSSIAKLLTTGSYVSDHRFMAMLGMYPSPSQNTGRNMETFKSIFPIQINLHIGLFACLFRGVWKFLAIKKNLGNTKQPFWNRRNRRLTFRRVTRRRYQRW